MGGGAKRPPLPKICHTYPTMIKLCTVTPYLKKIQNKCKSRHTPLEFCWHQYFFTGNQQILLYQEIQIKIIFWQIISNSFYFPWVFYNFDAITSVYTSEILSRDSNYIVNVVMWPKFGNSCISMREIIVNSIL